MIKKIVKFIISLFCKDCIIKANASIVKPSEQSLVSESKKKKNGI